MNLFNKMARMVVLDLEWRFFSYGKWLSSNHHLSLKDLEAGVQEPNYLYFFGGMPKKQGTGIGDFPISPRDAKAVLHGGIVLLAHEVVIPQGVVWPRRPVRSIRNLPDRKKKCSKHLNIEKGRCHKNKQNKMQNNQEPHFSCANVSSGFGGLLCLKQT